MTSNEKIILAIAAAAHFFTHFAMLSFPAMVMPLSRDLGLPVSEVVGLSFWMYFLYGVLAALWGWISDKWGHKPALGAGLIIAGLGLVLAGVYPSLTMLTVSFALVGVGCSSYHPAGTALVSQGIKERGRALGINGIWGSVGMALVPFAIGMFNFLIGWRGGLMIIGVIGLLLGIAGFFAPFKIEKGSDRMQTEPLDEKTARKLFIIFAVAMVFGGFLFRSFTLMLPTFLEYRLGDISEQVRLWVSEHIVPVEGSTAFNTLTANIVATFVYVVGIAGQWIGGRTADRYSLKHAYFFFFLIAVPFLLAILFFKSWVLIPASALFVLFLLGMQPIENSLVAYLTPAKWRSIGFGLKFTLVFGAGAFGVKLVSLVEKAAGLEAVMQLNLLYLLSIVLVAGVLLLASRKVVIRHF
ncbi:MAG: MFS transporter [Spirochaetaceae bacterium]|nr:MFS transporter [Spirochaetaceae bacterium]MCF7952258.1 MFS transporter [Spirochaetaceae bacterium]